MFIEVFNCCYAYCLICPSLWNEKPPDKYITYLFSSLRSQKNGGRLK